MSISLPMRRALRVSASALKRPFVIAAIDPGAGNVEIAFGDINLGEMEVAARALLESARTGRADNLGCPCCVASYDRLTKALAALTSDAPNRGTIQ